MATEFDDLMTDTVEVFSFSGQNAYGDPTHAVTPRKLAGHVVYDTSVVRDQAGNEVTSAAKAYIMGDPGIDLRDLVRFNDSPKWPVQMIAKHNDENGPHHVVVHV